MTPNWMTSLVRPTLTLGIAAIVCFTNGYGEDEPSSASDGSDGKQAAVTVKVAGTFESVRPAEVTAGNEQLTELKIERVVPHGTRVSKGQTLVWFETKKLDEKIRDAETDLQLATLALEADQFAHAQFLKQQALDKAKADRTRQIAQQEFDNYRKVDRDRTIKQAKFSLKSSEFSLESATEEYRQLEQMYKEDDLTEESEEIVLRRAKRAMESAQFSLERTQIQTKRTIEQSVPRSDAEQEERLARAMIDHEQATNSMANDRKKREIELRRKQLKHKKQTEDVAKMRNERKRVVLQSPIDGIFFHGQVTRGKPPAKPVDLKEGTSVAGKQIVGVVVDPGRLQIRVDLPEEHLGTVQKGVTCKVVPKAMPDAALSGVVKSVGIVPFTAGKYDCIVNVRGKDLGNVLPAMTCELVFTVGKDDEAKQSETKKSAK